MPPKFGISGRPMPNLYRLSDYDYDNDSERLTYF